MAYFYNLGCYPLAVRSADIWINVFSFLNSAAKKALLALIISSKLKQYFIRIFAKLNHRLYDAYTGQWMYLFRHARNILGVLAIHYMKSVQIWRFFWSVFSRIHYEYEKLRTRKNSKIEPFLGSYYLSTKNIQIQNEFILQRQFYRFSTEFFWSVFSRTCTKYEKNSVKKNFELGHFSGSDYFRTKKI